MGLVKRFLNQIVTPFDRTIQVMWHRFIASKLQWAAPFPDVGQFYSPVNETQQSIFDSAIWFAAPKSKVSPRRKKRKHLKYFPKRVEWVECKKCGEAKLPHRICTARSDVCAMRNEEWEEHKLKMSN